MRINRILGKKRGPGKSGSLVGEKMKNKILQGIIYKFKRGQVSAYSSDPRVFNCAIPADYWQQETYIGDVWITDMQGNVDPGLSCSPVPIHRDALGAVIGRL